MRCDCGCGVEEYFARLREVTIHVPVNGNLRHTAVGRRFLVRRVCYEPFTKELQAQALLNETVQRYVRARARWYWRATQFRKIARLQFVILSRNTPIEEVKKKSLRSAVLFVCSPKVADLLWRYWLWKDRNILIWRWKNRRPGLSVVRDCGTQPQIPKAAA